MHETQKKSLSSLARIVSPNQKAKFLSLGNIGIILACLALLMPLFSLPPTRLGYYSQVEACLIAFWAISAVTGLWVYFLGKKYPRLVYHTSKLPIVWGGLLLGVATLLISPFHALPLRDFTGYPHIAEGILTFIASGILACNFSILTRIAPYRKIIFTTALLVGLTICTLTLVGSMESPFMSWRYWPWAPYFFPDFLSFIDIALAALYLSIRKDFKGKHLNDIIAITLFAVIAYYASNKSLAYGIVFSIMATSIQFFPAPWRRNLLHLGFFGLSFALTILIAFYDDFSRLLPESFADLSTITSRTWLSKVTFVDLWATPVTWEWIQQLFIGKGWGTFSNISAANMFLIDQISIFSGKDYNPSWELVHRDLLHTHNILTNYFHSIGLLGVGLYLYIQYKLINSLSRNFFLIGVAFLISYQVQLLFWFQFMITLPFTLLTLSVLFRQRAPAPWSFLLKPKAILGFFSLLLIFSCVQGAITLGYQKGLRDKAPPTTKLVNVLLDAPYVRLEAPFGAQRQVGSARLFATALQSELEKAPQELVTYSLKLVNHLKSLPRDGNYLSNNLAINILSELASKPETLKFLDARTFKAWEQLAKDHIDIMPYRTDILLPFFNLYQTLGKEALVLEFTKKICDRNPRDPIGLWFMGSSLLKNPSHFDLAMCILQKSIHTGIERFMPVPPPLKTKIMLQAKVCPQDDKLLLLGVH